MWLLNVETVLIMFCSYLKAEWNYLNQDVTPLDLPIADRIWRHLPRRIDEKILTVSFSCKFPKLLVAYYDCLMLKIIYWLRLWLHAMIVWNSHWNILCYQVPQQKNDYDCGLFVLFFMERFIEEAPERLKKKDLAMVHFFLCSLFLSQPLFSFLPLPRRHLELRRLLQVH